MLKTNLSRLMELAALLAAVAALSIWGNSSEPPCGAFYHIPAATADGPAEPVALYLPNSWPRDIRIEKLGEKPPVKWWGLACDEVWMPAGSKFRAVSEGANQNYLYTIRPDGFLDYEFSPVD